jgi:flagellar biosynthesis/type III secretory pathway protein FliH
MSRILKGEPPAAGRRIEGAAFEARERARAVLAEAEAQANRIRADAEAASASVFARAVEEGRREGHARAAAVLLQAEAERGRRLAALEGEVAALALAVARKVLGDALAADRSAVVALASRALAEVRDRREVSVRVHPADAPALRDAASSLGALVARAGGISIQEDRALAPGDVLVETEAGRVDARIDTQLALLERALAEAGR